MSLALWKAQPDTLAFGVVPAFRRFELYQARYHELMPVIAEQAKKSASPLEILDVGAGDGVAKRFCDALVGPHRWTGVEIREPRIRDLKALGYHSLVTDVNLERQPLPHAEGTFDVVIASHVLEHLDNAKDAVADWMRVLKPGGSLLIGVPMHPGWLAALATWRYRWRGRKPHAHCHFFSMRSLGRFFEGYQVQRVWGFRIFSARQQLPLEDWEWFYRWSKWAGARFPSLSGEVNVHMVKPGKG